MKPFEAFLNRSATGKNLTSMGGSSNIPRDGSMNLDRSIGRRVQQSVHRALCIRTGDLASASDALLPRVEGHLVVSVRLHHVIGGSGNPAMMGGIQPRLRGRHPVPGGDQPTNTSAIREATAKTGRRTRGAWEYYIPVSVGEHAIPL